MFRLLWALSARLQPILRRWMPSNRILDLIRSRKGLKWGIPAMLLTVPYLLIVRVCVDAIQAGAPGWLNLIVLVAGWSALKFIIMGPLSVILLTRVRIIEAAQRRRTRRTVKWEAAEAAWDDERVSATAG